LLHPTQNPKVFGLTFARDAAASWVVSIFSEVGALFFLPPSSSSSSAQTSVNGLNQTRTYVLGACMEAKGFYLFFVGDERGCK
jgi:hypothetical protein